MAGQQKSQVETFIDAVTHTWGTYSSHVATQEEALLKGEEHEDPR